MAKAATAKAGHNSLSDQGKAFVERVENLHGDLMKLRMSYMSECKTVREDIAAVLQEAKEAQIPKKVIKTTVKVRELERKADEAREELDIADRDTFDNIRHALGDLADTPLGQAATAAAA